MGELGRGMVLEAFKPFVEGALLDKAFQLPSQNSQTGPPNHYYTKPQRSTSVYSVEL